jgi:hypothetical protein
MKNEEEAYQKIYDKKYHPMSKSQEEQKEVVSKEEQFELDDVNKHTCMKNIKRCIAKMKTLFGQDWNTDMPKFMQYLLDEF